MFSNLPVVPSALVSAELGFDQWTTDNGLPHNSINGLIQSSDGYIWLTTTNGIVRFDGVRFRCFLSGITPGIASDTYSYATLLQDKNGDIWAGTANAGVLRFHNNVFTSYSTNEGLPGTNVVRLDQGTDGSLWIFTEDGLARWKDGHIVSLAPKPGSVFNAFLEAPIQHLGDDAFLCGLWRQTASQWQRFAYGHWSTLPVPAYVTDPARLEITFIHDDAAHVLWYGIRDHPHEFYSVENGRLVTHKNTPPGAFVSFRDRNGFVWLGNHSGQFAKWKDGRSELQPELSTPTFVRGLLDRDGELWIGTLDKGLFHLRHHVFTWLPHPPPKELATPLLLDHSSNLWTGGYGLTSYAGTPPTTWRRDSTNRWLVNVITSLLEDSSHQLWAGFRQGVMRFANGRFLPPDGPARQIQSGVNVMHQDRAGTYWFGCTDGLWRINGSQCTRFTVADGLPASPISSLLEDRDGRLWIGTPRGLSVYVGGRLNPPVLLNGFSMGEVTALLQDSAGILWIGTGDHGLIRMKGNQLTAYSTSAGLGSSGVLTLVDDDRGFLWMTSRAGLLRIPKAQLADYADRKLSSLAPTFFDSTDGVPNATIRVIGQPGALRKADGQLLFSTIGGTIFADPGRIPFNRVPPPIRIEDCVVDRHVTPCQQQLSLPAHFGNLEIQYTALTSVKPERARFRYRLTGRTGDLGEGVERSWVEAGGRRSAYYSFLPAGNYTFEVTASNNDGVWNPQPQSLSIYVPRAYYATFWFRALAVLCLGALVGVAFYQRLQTLHRARQAQQTFSRQLIASSETERKRIAAELHDSLGQRLVVIKNLAGMLLLPTTLKNSPTAFMEEIVSEAAHAINEVKEISYNLRPYQLDRLGLTKAVEEIARTAAVASPIQFTSTIDNIDSLFPKDDEINFYRIVQEGVNNIVKHSGATRASIVARRDAGSLTLTIGDNGRGFSKSAELNVSRTGGFGLVGISERALLLGGTASIVSTPNEGTIIEILIHQLARTHV